MIRFGSFHSISNANESHQGKGDILKLMKAFVSAQESVLETPAY